ncbi:zinc finger MYND domain-containing protein 11-like [Amphiura filiformis]|uniref:zinc finger MYND domain-containing protein 11-like n=1 Tax=Amphiura filiformis TaxID=82378 RepID=UPI003B20C27E
MVHGVVKRRQADPQVVLQLWDIITSIRAGKQVANYDRIERYMQRKHNVNPKDTQKQLTLAVKDELVVKETSLGKKGARAGLEQDGYWCMEEATEESEDTHDWYCFECHKPGDVLCCGSCYKVYHPACAGKEDDFTDAWTCPMCEAHKDKFGSLKKIELYQLLTHVLSRMKDKARDLYKVPNMKELPNYYNLVYRRVDLLNILQKIDNETYRSLEEMEADTKMIVHCSVVYHGPESDRAELCRLTLADCEYDLAEIRLCKDCYLMSNNRADQDWFLYACDPNHELVWAQLRGFGYWPAKVLQRSEGQVDVRFFGSRHQRAWIPDSNTKPIDTNIKKMNIKPTPGWRNAKKELERHQGYVKEGNKGSGHRRGTKRRRDSNGDEESQEDDFVSSTDAGQDHSISTSQASPEAHTEDAPTPLPTPSKKVKRKSSHNHHNEDSSSSSNSSSNITSGSPLTSGSPRIVMTAAAAKAVAASSPSITLSPVKVKCNCEDKYTVKLENYKEKAEKEKEEAVAKAIEKAEADAAAAAATAAAAVAAAAKKKNGKKEKEKEKEKDDIAEKIEKAVADALKKAEKEWESEKQKAIKEAVKTAVKEKTESMEVDIENVKTEAKKDKEDQEQEMETLKTKYEEEIAQLKEEISQTKKRQWCINCEQEAMYHCCWNTSYCSITCQQNHWHKEHKRLCRRKR